MSNKKTVQLHATKTQAKWQGTSEKAYLEVRKIEDYLTTDENDKPLLKGHSCTLAYVTLPDYDKPLKTDERGKTIGPVQVGYRLNLIVPSEGVDFFLHLEYMDRYSQHFAYSEGTFKVMDQYINLASNDLKACVRAIVKRGHYPKMMTTDIEGSKHEIDTELRNKIVAGIKIMVSMDKVEAGSQKYFRLKNINSKYERIQQDYATELAGSEDVQAYDKQQVDDLVSQFLSGAESVQSEDANPVESEVSAEVQDTVVSKQTV